MDFPWVPSVELGARLAALPARQRKAVLRIVQAEAQEEYVALTRLLKTPYSCQWCGWVAGQSGMARDARKALLARHEESCERRGEPWRFVCSLSIYYRKWAHDPAFVGALEAARQEVTANAVASAVMGLQAGTVEAVGAVRKVIRKGEKDADRLRAAFGLLDRAGLETAPKGMQVVGAAYVDVSEGELAAIEAALREEGGGEGASHLGAGATHRGAGEVDGGGEAE